MPDPNLIPAGVDPQSPSANKVEAPEMFPGKTAPLPVAFAQQKRYYMCSSPNASMFRKDGKRITFRNGFYATNLLGDIDYLDAEIKDGHAYLTPATDEQIQMFNMMTDPRGTIEQELRGQLEPKIRAELENEVRADLMRELAAQQGEVSSGVAGENAIGGVDSVKQAIARRTALRSGNASVIMESKPAPLQGIVSSADLGGGAAGSAGQSDGGATNAAPSGNAAPGAA